MLSPAATKVLIKERHAVFAACFLTQCHNGILVLVGADQQGTRKGIKVLARSDCSSSLKTHPVTDLAANTIGFALVDASHEAKHLIIWLPYNGKVDLLGILG
jgi:pheromone shutdown protein TraB